MISQLFMLEFLKYTIKTYNLEIFENVYRFCNREL